MAEDGGDIVTINTPTYLKRVSFSKLGRDKQGAKLRDSTSGLRRHHSLVGNMADITKDPRKWRPVSTFNPFCIRAILVYTVPRYSYKGCTELTVRGMTLLYALVAITDLGGTEDLIEQVTCWLFPRYQLPQCSS
ncbi:Hypothetical predicted protein [Pelobates cultripes]|uniref:Uncharacterized protein n=1 Tax=Pelobates cultripes TaxID=61616 RepID=A0AAD1WJR0_PELCU|nr:Hypothetical predicted protein [Pelobates cultripes]